MLRKQQLTRCATCKLESVVPLMDESHETATGWHITLRCTSCFEVREVDVTQESADAFDTALDKQSRELTAAIRRWAHDNMQDYVNRFARALEADAIHPEDFVI